MSSLQQVNNAQTDAWLLVLGEALETESLGSLSKGPLRTIKRRAQEALSSTVGSDPALATQTAGCGNPKLLV